MSKKHGNSPLVYSTDPDFTYSDEERAEPETLTPAEQKLTISLDRKQRKGKVVTLIDGFIGTQEDLRDLERSLKQRCGTGGSAKDGAIIIQGDYAVKVQELLTSAGYGVRLLR